MSTIERLPALYLSHGAPPLADDPVWTRELAEWSVAFDKPKAILMISAHWEDAPLSMSATHTVPLVYDFWGFPEHYYQVQYAAPGAPQLAADVSKLLKDAGYATQQTDRGLDHGAYVPLVEMYPGADIPVLQISMPTLDPMELVKIGQRLAPLREQGVLIVGSGFTTHNLSLMDRGGNSYETSPAWSTEFDQWAKETVEARQYDDLIDFENKAPASFLAHPRTEHFAPLFVTLGASLHNEEAGKTAVDGFWLGMSKRSFQFD